MEEDIELIEMWDKKVKEIKEELKQQIPLKDCGGEKMTENKPVKKYRSGQIVLTEWKNTKKNDDGTEYDVSSYTLVKQYKNDKDEWKTTTSLNKGELAQGSALLHKAYEDAVVKVE